MGLLDPPMVQKKQAGYRHTYITGVAHTTSTNDLVNGLTFRVAHAFLSKPTAVRAIFYNHLATPVTFGQHYAASANQVTSTLSPATSSEWTAGGAVTCPAAIDSGSVSGLINPSVTYGPWIPVFPQESLSTPGTYIVLLHAVLQPANTTYWSAFEDVSWRASEPLNSGMFWACRQQSGSSTVANPGLFSDTTVRTRSAFAGMEALCEGKVINVMPTGDSITAGAGQTNYGMSDLYMAIKQINMAGGIGGMFLSHNQSGFGGQNSLGYTNRCLYAAPIIKPDIIIFTAGTPNDGVPSLTGQRANRFQIQQVIDMARSIGAQVIIRGWAPHSVVADNWPQGIVTVTPTAPVATVAGDSYRLDQNARCLAMDGQGIVTYWPGPAKLGDGAVPERYKTIYTDDTNHPNAPGYTYITADAVTAISRRAHKFF